MRVLKGFTIVELIAVITAIGILAGITAVGYNAIQKNAYDSAIQSDLRNLADQMDIFRANTGSLESYPFTTTDFASLGAKFTRNAYRTDPITNIIVCETADRKTAYTILAQSRSNIVYAVDANSTTVYPGDPTNFSWVGCAAYGMTVSTTGLLGGAWQAWAGSA